MVLILKSMPEMRGKGTDSSEVGRHEVVLAESQQNVGFAHSTVADYQQFRKIVIILVFSHSYIYIIIKIIKNINTIYTLASPTSDHLIVAFDSSRFPAHELFSTLC